ncbi:MAG: helix-turn-helix transcriptional regulator [Chloroflexi bacterium]|nr:helix-turn-helix transcriptional regulator [Chloroflexota bacterium]
MAFGNKISTLLGERRQSITDFSRRSGISYTTCYDLYHAKTKQITFDLLDRLCAYFEVEPWELFPYVPGPSEELVIEKPRRGRPPSSKE